MKYFLCVLILIATRLSFCQNFASDLKLLKNQFTIISNETRAESSTRGASLKHNLFKNTIQKQIGKQCVYEMECDEFAKSLFKKFGVIKASFLTIDRIGRCTHLSTLETLPSRLNKAGKIIERPEDYRLRP